MSKRNTIDYVCYNQDCKHNDKCFCQLKGVKPNGCINAMSKQGYELCIELGDRKIADLEAKLAEKDIDLSLARNEINTLKHNLNISQKHDNIMCEQYFNKCKETNQDKIDFAVAELEKVKEKIMEETFIYVHTDRYIDAEDFDRILDQQIKGLKEMK